MTTVSMIGQPQAHVAQDIVTRRTGLEVSYVADLADACVLMQRDYAGVPLNIRTGEGVAIRELVEMVTCGVELDANLVFDAAKPDGTPQILLHVSRMRELRWQERTALEEGIRLAYADFLETQDSGG